MPDLFDTYDLGVRMQRTLNYDTADLALIRATNYLRLVLGVEFDRGPQVLAERYPRWTTWVRLTGPLHSVESVTVDGSPLTSPDGFEQARRGVTFPDGLGWGPGDWADVEIRFTAGFAQIPDDLADWGMFLAAQAYPELAKVGVASTTIAADGVSEQVTYTDNADGSSMGAIALPIEVLRDLQHKYGSARPRAASIRIR